jgi:hypothetical protein
MDLPPEGFTGRLLAALSAPLDAVLEAGFEPGFRKGSFSGMVYRLYPSRSQMHSTILRFFS